MTGVVFETACEDGVGYVLAALLVTEKGKQFSLRQYYQVRSKYVDKTELIGPERSTNPADDIDEFMDALGIGHEFLVWRYK
jgi:hypothetical protein